MPKRRKSEKVVGEHHTWNLFRHKNGIFWADGRSNKPPQGRFSLHAATRPEAIENLKKLDRACAGIEPTPTEESDAMASEKVLSLQEGKELFIKHVSRPSQVGGGSQNTKKKYRAAINKLLFAASKLKVKSWNDVSNDTLVALATMMENGMMKRPNGYAPRSISSDLGFIKTACNWLIEANHVSGTPLDLKIKKGESQRYYCYTTRQYEHIVQHCLENNLEWLHDNCVALATTGLRIGELSRLRWTDVDFENNRVLIREESGHAKKRHRERRKNKSKKSRSFPIHRDLRPVLERRRKDHSNVFRGIHGGMLTSERFLKRFRIDVLKPLADLYPSSEDELGFIDGVSHSFRAYFCSCCANSGVPIMVVMNWLGHADSKMVRHYYHLHDEVSQQQMNQVRFLAVDGGRPAIDDKDIFLEESTGRGTDDQG